MAGRNTKQGLDYFSLDVDFFNDEKIEFVSARFGIKGEIIAIRLLCKIYRIGYHTEWNDDESTLLAKRAGEGITPTLVSDVVNELVRRGFFDEAILNSFGILTSVGIQKRYAAATAERKEIEIRNDIWLINTPKNARFSINPPINSISPPINSINRPANEQSKVKKSKENKPPIIPPSGDGDCDFAVAWERYGRKGNKKTSERRWANLKKHCREAALKHITLYVASTPDRQYRKNFETYLNQEAWNDEIVERTKKPMYHQFTAPDRPPF